MSDLWDAVERAARAARGRSIAALLEDPARADAFSVRAGGMLLDYSKTTLDHDARAALLALAGGAGLEARRKAMFRGDPINETEGRAVLHTALRNLSGEPVMQEGSDIMPGIHATRARMAEFAEAVRAGPVTDVVNIGIGVRIWDPRWRCAR